MTDEMSANADGEQRDGDTSVVRAVVTDHGLARIPEIPTTTVLSEKCGKNQRARHPRQCLACNLDGEALTIDDFAASMWLIQNKGRAPEDCETLPEGITAEHVERAIIRHRKEATRKAIEAHKAALSTALPPHRPRPKPRPADDRGDYTGRVPVWVFVLLVLVIGLATWGGIDLVAMIGKGLW